MYYAQIDQTGICFAVSQLSREVTANNMIAINSYDTTLLGKRWNGTNWEEVPRPDTVPELEPAPETTEQKLARLEEQNLILMDALATTFEEVMALRAIVEGETAE